MKNMSLIVAGLVFSLVAAMHGWRFYKGWEIMIAQNAIPLQWSIYGGIIAAALAIWMFVAASK